MSDSFVEGVRVPEGCYISYSNYRGGVNNLITCVIKKRFYVGIESFLGTVATGTSTVGVRQAISNAQRNYRRAIKKNNE